MASCIWAIMHNNDGMHMHGRTCRENMHGRDRSEGGRQADRVMMRCPRHASAVRRRVGPSGEHRASRKYSTENLFDLQESLVNADSDGWNIFAWWK